MDERLQRLLGGSELLPLRQRLRRHFERRDDGIAAEVLQLTQLEAIEHAALAALTGRPARPSRSTRVDIAAIDAALRAAGVAESLRAALEALDGPITSRTAARAAQAAAWATATQASPWHPLLQTWVQTLPAGALLKRLSKQDATAAAALLARADAVLQRLPARGLARAQLAAEVLGSSHALDAGQPVATVVLAVWRGLDSTFADESDGDAERSRDIWARAGVLVNELARPALMLNLPGYGAAGEPAYSSLRQLLRTPPAWAVGGQDVFVCENPNLLAIAADRLGAHCAPLVCTDGMPAAAQRTLLKQLMRSGACLRCHGDFDWPGVRIANHVLREFSATRWRMDTSDYEAAATQKAGFEPHPLAGSEAQAAWDARLSAAMRRHGVAIAEESVADALMGDLSRH